MDWLVSIGTTAKGLLVVFSAIISFVAWKRVGFKAPTYIHVIAFISGCNDDLGCARVIRVAGQAPGLQCHPTIHSV